MLDLDKTASDSDKVETLHAAMKLFNEIDINCDGTMEWSEFLQYMIDQVATESLQPYYDKVTNTYVSIQDILSQRSESIFRKFKLTPKEQMVDTFIHRGTINRAFFCNTSGHANIIFHMQQK